MEQNLSKLELAKNEFIKRPTEPALSYLADKYDLNEQDIQASADIEDWDFLRDEYQKEYTHVVASQVKDSAALEGVMLVNSFDGLLANQAVFAERILPKIYARLEQIVSDNEDPLDLEDALAVFEKISKSIQSSAKLMLEVKKLMQEYEDRKAKADAGANKLLTQRLEELRDIALEMEKRATVNKVIQMVNPQELESLLKNIEE